LPPTGPYQQQASNKLAGATKLVFDAVGVSVDGGLMEAWAASPGYLDAVVRIHVDHSYPVRWEQRGGVVQPRGFFFGEVGDALEP
jgi:hypothetical protein